MTTGSAFVPALAVRAGLLRLARSSWADLTIRKVSLALGAALALAMMQGAGTWMLFRQPDRWRLFVLVLVPNVTLVLAMLVCLTVAAHVRIAGVPRPVPFMLGAAAAAALTFLVENVFSDWFDPSDCCSWYFLALQFMTQYVLLAGLAAFAYMYALDARRRTRLLRELQLERTRVAREAYEARLRSLQAQVEPRFLFDTLAEIEGLYETNHERGQRLLDDLIIYLRTALPALDEGPASLRRELLLVRTWLEVVRERVHGRLSFSIAAVEPPDDACMPPMVLLPIVQGAVESRIESAPHACTLALTSASADGRLRVVVSVSGHSFAPAAEWPAIAPIRERLYALYASEATLVFRSTGLDGLDVTLEIPHETPDRRHR